MSATGLGVCLYSGPIPWSGTLNPGTTMLYVPKDHEYAIVHVFLSNISKIASVDIELGISTVPMFVNDMKKFMRRTLLPEEVIDLGIRVQLPVNQALCATCSIAIGDEMAWGSFYAEVQE